MEELLWPNKITTDRLVLRELLDEDLDFVYYHFSNEEVCRYSYDEEPLGHMEDAQEIINWYKGFASKGHCRWGLELKSTGQLIGTCGFHCFDSKNHRIEIGYDLNKEYWGQGFMKEALEAIIEIAFCQMKLNRIEAYIFVDNTASYRLLEKLHFQREGIVRDKHLFRGNYYDHYCYSLLAKDFTCCSFMF